MARGAEVVVAGAGVMGLTVALALADRGCRVTVCDPSPQGCGASAVAAGMLAPVFEALLDESATPYFDLLLSARDLWPALARRANIGLDRGGAMAVGPEDWLEALESGMARLGPRGVRLGAPAAQALAPGLSPSQTAALLNREDWRVEARAALGDLARAAAEAGVGFRREMVTGRGSADFLIVATGAGRGILAPEQSCLSPIKGHILRLASAHVGGVVVRAPDGYVAPERNGRAVGATMEPGVWEASPDPAQAAILRARAERLFPGSGGIESLLEAGIRAATPDGLPLVGPSTEPGIILATGARRNGWLLAPLAARLAAGVVTGSELGPHAGLLAPGRFT